MSGPHPPHGLQVTVSSGPQPKHGNPTSSMTTEHQAEAARRDRETDAEAFTRRDVVSVRLAERKLHRFFVLVSSETPGEIRIESIEIEVYEDDESVFNIPVSTSGVTLNKRSSHQFFNLTDQQFVAVSEHLRKGNTVRVTVRYVAADQSELKISIVEKDSHTMRQVLTLVGLGFALPPIIKRLLRAPPRETIPQ
jgi:hypothetical protein